MNLNFDLVDKFAARRFEHMVEQLMKDSCHA